MPSNPLIEILSPEWRQRLYVVYGVVGLVIGAIQVGFGAAGDGQPEALVVALAVYAYIGIALGFTAASNVKNASGPTPPGPAH